MGISVPSSVRRRLVPALLLVAAGCTTRAPWPGSVPLDGDQARELLGKVAGVYDGILGAGRSGGGAQYPARLILGPSSQLIVTGSINNTLTLEAAVPKTAAGIAAGIDLLVFSGRPADDRSPTPQHVLVRFGGTRGQGGPALGLTGIWPDPKAPAPTLEGDVFRSGTGSTHFLASRPYTRSIPPVPLGAEPSAGATPEEAIGLAQRSLLQQEPIELAPSRGGRYEARSCVSRRMAIPGDGPWILFLHAPDLGHDVAVTAERAAVRRLPVRDTRGVLVLEVTPDSPKEACIDLTPVPNQAQARQDTGRALGVVTVVECKATPRPTVPQPRTSPSVDDLLTGLAAVALGFLIYDAAFDDTPRAERPPRLVPEPEYGDYSPCITCGRIRAYDIPGRCLCEG